MTRVERQLIKIVFFLISYFFSFPIDEIDFRGIPANEISFHWFSNHWIDGIYMSPTTNQNTAFSQVTLILGITCPVGLLGQSFSSSGCRRRLLQDEDHSGIQQSLWDPTLGFVPWFVLNAFRDVSGAVPEWPWISGFMRKWSRRANAPSMRFFVLLNSDENFLVTLPSISSETWVM